MVDFVFTSRKQYWSAIKNLHKNINNTDSSGENARSSFRVLTGKTKYNEKNFEKRLEKGKSFSILEVRKDFSKARKKAETNLKKEWKQARKEGVTDLSWKKFKEINTEPDYKEIQESFNSPT